MDSQQGEQPPEAPRRRSVRPGHRPPLVAPQEVDIQEVDISWTGAFRIAIAMLVVSVVVSIVIAIVVAIVITNFDQPTF